jgi:GNAT superfamily N-acetyltransferase
VDDEQPGAAHLSERDWPLVVRRARAEDEAAVMAFASTTWDGWDYMPMAWPRWLDDPGGVLLVGTRPDGTPVAVVRVALPAPGEAWLEGIRVDPAVRGLDVATDLQAAELHWAAAAGARIVRYATGSRNEGSHRLGARGGFEHVATLLSTWWAPHGEATGHDDDEPSGFLPDVRADAQRRRRALLSAAKDEGLVPAEGEADALWSMVRDDAGFVAGERLYEPRPWALEELTEGKFRRHVVAGEVLRLRAYAGWAVAVLVADVEPAEDAALRFAVLLGEPNAAFDLLERSRTLAGEAIRFRYPEGAALVSSVEQRYRDAGYHFPEWALHILVRPLDGDHAPPPVDARRLILADPPAAPIDRLG